MTREEEARVLRDVRDGQKDRFAVLVQAHQKGVYNLCLRMLGNEQDALDASQEAFFRAYRGLGSFRGDSRFSVWLYRLASNVCLDMLRKRPAVPDLSLTGEDDETIPLPDARFSPVTALEKRELREAVQQALGKLPHEFRQILLLREIGELSYDEIARATGLEPGTVKSRLFRARKKLAALLMRDGNFSEYIPSKTPNETSGAKGGADA